MHNIKFIKQETDYTCAIACIRMITDSELSENELSTLSKTSEKYGTHPDDIVKTLEYLGYESFIIEGKDNGIDLVRQYHKNGYNIILLISVDVPHCVVFLTENNNHIFYHDPYFGSNKSCSIKNFTSNKRKYPNIRWLVETDSLKKYYPNIIDPTKFLVGKQQFIATKKR